MHNQQFNWKRLAIPALVIAVIFGVFYASRKGTPPTRDHSQVAIESFHGTFRGILHGSLNEAVNRAFDDFESGRQKAVDLVLGRPWGRFIRGTNVLGWKETYAYQKDSASQKYLVVEVPELKDAAQRYLALSSNATQTLTDEQWSLLFPGTNSSSRSIK